MAAPRRLSGHGCTAARLPAASSSRWQAAGAAVTAAASAAALHSKQYAARCVARAWSCAMARIGCELLELEAREGQRWYRFGSTQCHAPLLSKALITSEGVLLGSQ
jgi:hypothetical protein